MRRRAAGDVRRPHRRARAEHATQHELTEVLNDDALEWDGTISPSHHPVLVVTAAPRVMACAAPSRRRGSARSVASVRARLSGRSLW